MLKLHSAKSSAFGGIQQFRIQIVANVTSNETETDSWLPRTGLY